MPDLIQGSLLLLVLQLLDTHVLIILLYPHLHRSHTGRGCEQGVKAEHAPHVNRKPREPAGVALPQKAPRPTSTSCMFLAFLRRSCSSVALWSALSCAKLARSCCTSVASCECCAS